MIAKIWNGLFFTSRLLLAVLVCCILFVLAYFFSLLYPFAIICLLTILIVVLFELFILFKDENTIVAYRTLPKRFSNGDDNSVLLDIRNNYPAQVNLEIIDEIPFQFQRRDILWEKSLDAGQESQLTYKLRPVKRGEYKFGGLNIIVSLGMHLVQRKFSFSQEAMVKVYPSFLQMRKYEIAAFTNDLTDLGIKKLRKLGQSQEFDQIKEYVRGDDPRVINWKATARKNALMVNQYVDEKSQPIYCMIDKGRLMQMPFNQLTLLDYAINASLVLLNIGLKKDDKAGLITFSNKISSILKADKSRSQIYKIQEILYNQKTQFAESNFELVSAYTLRKITQRSLLVLFTNFESFNSFKRQLNYFKVLQKRHLLVVVFFRNTELKNIIESNPNSINNIYTQVIAEKSEYEKDLIVKELKINGIYSVLTTPENLNINTINKYLELKRMGKI